MSVLIRNLPTASAFVQAAAPGGVRWSVHEELTALSADVTAAAAGSDWRVPRPGVRERELSNREIRKQRWEERQRARRDAATDERTREVT